jgi:hypothetical protein
LVPNQEQTEPFAVRGCRQTTKKTCRSNAASGAKFRRIPAKTPGSNWVAILIPVPQRETGLTGTPYAVTPPGIIHYFQLHATILDVGVKPI